MLSLNFISKLIGQVMLQMLHLSHCNPVHPASHPLSHRPVTWLQVMPSLQCPTHGWEQFTPYHLIPQANKNCCVFFNSYTPPAAVWKSYQLTILFIITRSLKLSIGRKLILLFLKLIFLLCYENVTLLS